MSVKEHNKWMKSPKLKELLYRFRKSRDKLIEQGLKPIPALAKVFIWHNTFEEEDWVSGKYQPIKDSSEKRISWADARFVFKMNHLTNQ